MAAAAARTSLAVSPVRACSLLPPTVCRPWGWDWLGAGALDGVDVVPVVVEPDVAALAIAAPPTAAAATAAAVVSVERRVSMVLLR